MYIPISNPQGGGVDISSLLGKKSGVRAKLSWNIGKAKDKDSSPKHLIHSPERYPQKRSRRFMRKEETKWKIYQAERGWL